MTMMMMMMYCSCAPPATNAVPSAAGVRVIVLALDERFLRRCSVYPLQLVDGAGWSAMEHSVAVVDPRKDQTASVCARSIVSR